MSKQVFVVTDTGNPISLANAVAALGASSVHKLTVAAPSQAVSHLQRASWDAAVIELGTPEAMLAAVWLHAKRVPIIAVTVLLHLTSRNSRRLMLSQLQ